MTSNLASDEIAQHALQLREEATQIQPMSSPDNENTATPVPFLPVHVHAQPRLVRYVPEVVSPENQLLLACVRC